jgi:hypothetical protein
MLAAASDGRACSLGGRASNGEDKFGPAVIGGAFTLLQQAHLLETAESPAAK